MRVADKPPLDTIEEHRKQWYCDLCIDPSPITHEPTIYIIEVRAFFTVSNSIEYDYMRYNLHV